MKVNNESVHKFLAYCSMETIIKNKFPYRLCLLVKSDNNLQAKCLSTKVCSHDFTC